jgi:hypothetical protein
MARKYRRDNRGRFAGGGGGATARGGRLKTASGKKRATQTMQAGGAKASGAIKGRVKRDPGAAGKIGQGKTRASKTAPSAATIAQVGRERRATRNLNAAMKREGEGPNSKASRSASVAKRARAIYAGKVDPKAKTRARLTKTTDSEALRKRVKKIKDNTTAKPAANLHGPVGQISQAKAGRIVARIDANRPGLRKATGSARKTANSIRTHRKATDFALAAGARARKQGKSISVNESLQRGVKNAAAKNASRAAANKVAAKRIKATAPKNTTANRTGQSKTLNKFNSRPVGTMVLGKGINLVPSTKRVPLDIQRKSSDEAFARMATKAARVRAAAPAKAAAKQTTAQRASRAASNQKRVVASIQAKGGRRPTPSRKQRRSLLTAEAAKRFYSSGAIDRLKVNVKKPGFRLPRGMR